MKRLIPVFVLLLGAARADYSIPRAAETRFVVAHEWKLDRERLATEHGTFRIDLFWLADRINSNLICCGDHEAGMRKYLRGLDRDAALVVELVNLKKGEPLFVAGIRPLTPERIRNDLALEARRVGDGIEVKLVNRSKVPYRIVLPKDGSESGWREPHVFFTGELDGRALAKRPIGRCGLYAHEWQKDIVELKPGESRPIGDGYAGPVVSLEIPRGRRAKIRAHYVYRGGAKDGPGAMGKTPAFELVSEPVEFEIR